MWIRCWEEILCCVGGEALAQFVWRGCGFCIPGGIQGCTIKDFGQTDLLGGAPDLGRGVGIS